MEYKIDHDFPTMEELKQYSKDTLLLIKQNKWLSIKLLIGVILGASVIGAIIVAPTAIGLHITRTGYSPEFLYFFYSSLTDFFKIFFSCVPFWLILFYTGFRLMENRQVIIPARYIVKKQITLLGHLWTPGILLACFAFFIIFSGLFTSYPSHLEENLESSDLTIAELVSKTVYILNSKSLLMGIGFYWFSFIHIMIFNALLFGKEFTPNISYTLQKLFFPRVSFDQRMRAFFAFVVIDLVAGSVCILLNLMLPAEYGLISSIIFRALYYLFIAGVLYCYCVDKIEGRKLKKKVEVETFSGSMAPSVG